MWLLGNCGNTNVHPVARLWCRASLLSLGDCQKCTLFSWHVLWPRVTYNYLQDKFLMINTSISEDDHCSACLYTGPVLRRRRGEVIALPSQIDIYIHVYIDSSLWNTISRAPLYYTNKLNILLLRSVYWFCNVHELKFHSIQLLVCSQENTDVSFKRQHLFISVYWLCNKLAGPPFMSFGHVTWTISPVGTTQL